MPDSSRFLDFLHFFRRAPLSSSFAGICCLVYLAMVYTGAHFADPHSRALIDWGGNYRALTLQQQPWRIFTAIFIHGGWLHLTMNTMAIFDICYLLERRIGAVRLLLVLLLSGIAAGLCSMIWSPLLVSVGASGAIMGAAGTLLVWLAAPNKEATSTSGITPFVALIIGITVTLGAGLFWHRLDNAAHIGGLISGIVLGLLLYPDKHLNNRQQTIFHLALLITGLLLARLTINKQTTDEYLFRAQLPTIHATLLRYADSIQWLNGLQAGSGITLQQVDANWQKCINLTSGWQHLRLSPSQERLRQQLFNVCSLQQQQYQFTWRQADTLFKIRSNQQFIRHQSQINGLYQNLLPMLRQELAIEFAIQRQIGPATPKLTMP